MAMGPVKEILDLARRATIAVVGIGTVGYNGLYGAASAALAKGGYAEVTLPAGLQELVDQYGDLGQIAARIYTPRGTPCAEPWDRLVVGLTLAEIQQIPLCMGVAAGAIKAVGIHGALKAGYVKILVTDEAAAAASLDRMGQES
jgi:DNA-binding transcriptional regulator LsrR (DeoR family)